LVREATAAHRRTTSLHPLAGEFAEKCARWASTLEGLKISVLLEASHEWFSTDVDLLQAERFCDEQSPGVVAARTNTIVVVDDRTSGHWPVHWSAVNGAGGTSVAAVPLRVGGAVIGSMTFYATGFRTWSPDRLDAAWGITANTAEHLARCDDLMRAREAADALTQPRTRAAQRNARTSTTGRVPLCFDDGGTLIPLFFSDTDVDVARAQMICRQCPTRDLCLRGAIERQEPRGVWGGKIFYDGVAVDRRRRPGRRRKVTPEVAELPDSA
jgi:hypothetical protein